MLTTESPTLHLFLRGSDVSTFVEWSLHFWLGSNPVP